MKKINIKIALALTIVLCISWIPKKYDSSQLKEVAPINVIVLLDLSNRIDPIKNPGQAESDQVIIESILNVFGKRQKQFGYMISKDHFSIVCANQAHPSFQKSQFIDGLSINMKDHMNRPRYDRKKLEVIENSSHLYKQAVEKAESGADIYTWFKDHLPNRLRGDGYINKIVIITDGYLAFDEEVARRKSKGTQIDWNDFSQLRNNPKNWKSIYENKQMGFIPHQIDYGNTEVLFMEVKPRKTEVYSHELDILKQFWTDWLQKMNMKGELIPQFDSRDQLNYTLSKFIN